MSAEPLSTDRVPRSPVHPRPARVARLAVALALPLGLGACDWFTDFKHQPRIEPWEPLSQLEGDTLRPPRGQPQLSVPVTGTFAAAYQVSYAATPATLDSLARLPNPTPVSPASLANGRKYYQINCAVCHGDLGQGNGPAVKYGMAGINIVLDGSKARSDGYIYGMLRNGRGLMPTYNRIEEMDRWDVVNYVRALQGVVPNTAGVGPTGYPGQNGSTLPTYTVTAPTRPAPHWRDARGPIGGMRPEVAPQVRAPDEAGAGTQGAPVPGAVNDSGPQGRLNTPPATAPAAPPQTKGGTRR